MTNKEAYEIISQRFYEDICLCCEKAHCIDATILYTSDGVYVDCKAHCVYSEALCKLKECVEECEDK